MVCIRHSLPQPVLSRARRRALFPGNHQASKSFPVPTWLKALWNLLLPAAVGRRPPCSLLQVPWPPHLSAVVTLPPVSGLHTLLHPLRLPMVLIYPFSLGAAGAWYVGSLTSSPRPHSKPGKVMSRKQVLMGWMDKWLTPGYSFLLLKGTARS